MRHRKNYRKLNRATDQRVALLRGLVSSLLRHNRIKTTVEKAKEASRLAERLITLAKRGDLAARRRVLRRIPDRDLVKYLFDESQYPTSSHVASYFSMNIRILPFSDERYCRVHFVASE